MTRLWTEGETIEVWGSPNAPSGFLLRGAAHSIRKLCNRWQVHTRWWEPGEKVWREYLKVTTDDGLLCLIGYDRLGGQWFLARFYD